MAGEWENSRLHYFAAGLEGGRRVRVSHTTATLSSPPPIGLPPIRGQWEPSPFFLHAHPGSVQLSQQLGLFCLGLRGQAGKHLLHGPPALRHLGPDPYVEPGGRRVRLGR